MNKKEKQQQAYIQFAAQITSAISDMLNNPESEWHISPDTFDDNDNTTAFMHALANVAPAHIFNVLTGNDMAQLEFNHLANRLCFQFGTLVDADGNPKD